MSSQEKTPQKFPVEKTPHPILGLWRKPLTLFSGLWRKPLNYIKQEESARERALCQLTECF